MNKYPLVTLLFLLTTLAFSSSCSHTKELKEGEWKGVTVSGRYSFGFEESILIPEGKKALEELDEWWLVEGDYGILSEIYDHWDSTGLSKGFREDNPVYKINATGVVSYKDFYDLQVSNRVFIIRDLHHFELIEPQPVDTANASNAAGVDLKQLPRIR